PTESASFQRIGDLFQRNDDGAALEAEGELKAVLARFFRAATPMFSRRGGADSAVESPDATPEPIRRALLWLGQNYARTDALQKLSDRAKLSADHFRRAFRRATGMNP